MVPALSGSCNIKLLFIRQYHHITQNLSLVLLSLPPKEDLYHSFNCLAKCNGLLIVIIVIIIIIISPFLSRCYQYELY